MSKKNYYLGLDIGTDSVGFCVTDRDYNIVTKRAVRYRLDGKRYYTKKHLWGARLFEEASDAADRRSHRTARRRYQRRRWRLLLLREFFQDEINKIDSTFFDRLDHSFFHEEDKPESLRGLSIPYPEKKKTKEYYSNYKTIYHLRYELLTNPDKKFDLREIYLAFAHMVKYRGNFLHEGDIQLGSSSSSELKDKFDEIDGILSEMNNEEDEPIDLFHLTPEQAVKLYEYFQKETRKSVLKEKEREILSISTKKDVRSLLLELVNGSDVKIVELFPEFKEDEGLKDEKIIFNGDDYEAKTLPLLSSIGDDLKMSLILKAKEIYDFRILANLLQGKESVSAAMVSLYDKHNKDLQKLKALMRTYVPQVYVAFFKKVKEKVPSYASYVGFNKLNNGKQESSLGHKTTKDDLYKRIKEILPKDLAVSEEDRKVLDAIYQDMEAGTFLPRQNSKDNGVLPYQLTFDEMRKIIENQKKFYPFLAEEATDFRNPGKTCYKLLSLVSFRVPYYVGPLTDDKGENHWMKRKVEGVKITPWNFFDVVDTSASGEEFIKRMKNVCTYLLHEETLPKNSLLYTEYVLLNEMNNWLINGKPISQEDKEYLIQEVYLKVKKPTKKHLVDALCRKYNVASRNEVRIQTRTSAELDSQDMHANLVPWMDLSAIFGREVIEDPKLREKAEKAIETITVFEARKERQKKLQELGFEKGQIKELLKLNYSGWGKLSKTLLDGITTPVVNVQTGEEQDLTIIELMRREPLNLMEIIESKNKFEFRKKIDALNEEGELTLDDVIENEYVSPGMKRALHQSVKIVQELKKILDIEEEGFDSYFVECTREKSATPTRTVSRLKRLKDLYSALKVDKELRDSLGKETDENLRKDKLFLYYLQLGKSVYTGKPIDLDNFKDYDIDHIIPQEKLKDDSIDNRVLVEKSINNKKSDSYPIPKECLMEEGRRHIEVLYSKMLGNEHVLMSSEKYRRLTRLTPLTEEEETGFVNRQLVMTNQAVKAVCDVLKFIDPKAKIVYSKASIVSDFRKTFGLVKSRDVNDFHHAHDAYLNIVVGNVYNKVFSSSFDVERLRKVREQFESTKIDVEHFFKRDERQTGTSTLVWKAKRYDKETKTEDPASEGTIDLVRANIFNLYDPMITKMPKSQKGMFGKVSIHPKDGSAVLPLKSSGPLATEGFATKYGGYNDLTAPDFMLVKSIDKKKKTIYTLENIPAVYRSKLKDEKSKVEYLTTTLGLKNPKIILPVVKINTIVEFNDPDGKGHARVTINGKTGKQIVASIASPLWLPLDFVKYVKILSVFMGSNLPAGIPKPKHADNDEDIKVGNSIISKKENQILFDYLCDDVFKRACFSLVPGVSTTLKDVVIRKEQFDELSTKKQAELLHHLIALLQNNNSKADLRYLGMGANVGLIQPSKTMKALSRFIAQSVTGFYEKVLFTIPPEE